MALLVSSPVHVWRRVAVPGLAPSSPAGVARGERPACAGVGMSPGRVFVMDAPRMTHLPALPTWDCRLCSAPWLCHGGKIEIAAAFDDQLQAPELRYFLDFALRSAVRHFHEHGQPNPTDVAQRLFGWLVAAAIEPVDYPRPARTNAPDWPSKPARPMNGPKL